VPGPTPVAPPSSPADRQRRPEYARDEAWIRSLLRRARIAHVGTVADGQPFVTPTNYFYDEDGGRIIFHSNVAGRLRSNLEANPRAALEVCEVGRVLPSNAALEFSVQYRSVMVFGTVGILTDPAEQAEVLHRLIGKYFEGMHAGQEYRAVTTKELKRTTVYALKIEAWSGKENWKERADQSDEWPPLSDKWFR
jgi:nitroimidazol reductase NimA-like FMN-containing flavoprotein (pyridoxamine 5'-phosphate oxidase superfamily)